MRNFRTGKGTICGAVALLLWRCGAVAQAAIINVPADYATIQAAIDAAISGPDEIIVAPGTYQETIDFDGKAVHLRSAAGPNVTIIDAAGVGRVVTCNSGEINSTILEGFTITGGDATNQSPDNEGGGMLNLSTRPTVINCIFLNNAAGAGGGMFNSGNASVTNCRFISNSATTSGGGMYNTASPTITNCAFENNTAQFGGAMRNTSFVFNGNATPLINDCTFLDNSADCGGAVHSGALGSSTSRPRFTRCAFTENTADNGAALYYSGNSDSRITNCLLVGNSADVIGPIFLDATHNVLAITSTTMVNNFAPVGGAMHDAGNAVITWTNSISWSNFTPFELATATGSLTVNYSIVEGGWTGPGGNGVLNVNPMFVDIDGEDNVAGTMDDNLRLADGSPAIDAGRNSYLPVSLTTDLDENPRRVDDPGTADTGNGTAPLVDIGAYEWQIPITCPADLAKPAGAVDVFDLFILLGNWGTAGPGADLDAPTNIVDVFDLFVLLGAWGDCK